MSSKTATLEDSLNVKPRSRPVTFRSKCKYRVTSGRLGHAPDKSRDKADKNNFVTKKPTTGKIEISLEKKKKAVDEQKEEKGEKTKGLLTLTACSTLVAMAANNENAWKAFDTSTEAGRLLRQIYGKNGPPVNCPIPRRSKQSLVPSSTSNWRPVSNRPDQVDPRAATRSLQDEKKVKTVRRARKETTFARIDFVERRRAGSLIAEEVPCPETLILTICVNVLCFLSSPPVP